MSICKGVGNIGAGASANDLILSYAPEKEYAVVPETHFREMRVTSESLAMTEDTTNDSEIRNDRMGGTPIRTALHVGGDIGIEPSYRNFEDFFEGAMFDCWKNIYDVNVSDVAFGADKTITSETLKTAYLQVGDRIFIQGSVSNDGEYTIAAVEEGIITVAEDLIEEEAGASVYFSAIKVAATAGDIFFASEDKSINSTAFDFTELDIVPHQYIRVLGTTNNNKDFKVVSVAANKIIVEDEVAAENPEGIVTLGGSRLRNGIVNHSYTIEKNQVPGEYYQYAGMMVNELSLDISTGSVLSGTISFMGKSENFSAESRSKDQKTKKAFETKIYNSISDIGTVTVDGAKAPAAIQSLSFSIGNNIEEQQQVGSLENAGVFVGNFDVTGSISLYYKDATIYNSFLKEENKIISFPVTYENKGYRFTINGRLNNASKETPGVNQSIIQSYDLTAIPLNDYKIEIDRF